MKPLNNLVEKSVKDDLERHGHQVERIEDTDGMPDFLVVNNGYCEAKSVEFTRHQVKELPDLTGVTIALVPTGWVDERNEHGIVIGRKKAVVGQIVYVDASQFFPKNNSLQ